MINYDLMAEDFDTEERIKRAKAFADELRKHIADGGNKSAVDFGCGTGLVGFELIDSFDSMTFIDSSVGMINQVEQKIFNKGISNARAMCCDLMKTALNNLSADYIFSSLALHHIIDTEAVLVRLFDLLHKDGHLLIIDLDTDDGSFHAHHPDFDGHNGFGQPFLKGLCEKTGFGSIEIKTFYRAHKTVKGQERPYSFFILDAIKSLY